MTQLNGADGKVTPVTLIEAGPCFVTQVRTMEREGYEAVQLGFEEVNPKRVTAAERGHLKRDNLNLPPLRHLHGPDECLRGAGFDVAYLGTSLSPLPTAVYRATAPSGESYRVDVSFVSDKGETVASVAGAIWRWLHRDGAVWTAVQRVSPGTLPESEHERWSAAVLAALDLNTTAASLAAVNEGGRR